MSLNLLVNYMDAGVNQLKRAVELRDLEREAVEKEWEGVTAKDLLIFDVDLIVRR